MDKIAICYTCCGPTYRKTARDKLINLHKDNPDIYFFVITEDVDYFSDINRKNLIVKNLKEFYPQFPHVEEYEYFLESSSKEDYAEKFLKQEYRFPFSTNRFHLLLAHQNNIKNVALLGTDTDLIIDRYLQIKEKNNIIYNCVSRWDQKIQENNMHFIVDFLNSKYDLSVDDEVRIYDAAGKLFCFSELDIMAKFFEIWDQTMLHIYKNNSQNLFWGSYAINNEYILAPIYNTLNIKGAVEDFGGLFDCKHSPDVERFWM
tara:strand:- start:66 stop:845 length:780 start_codon:yes stop_codon:yes gene_type:complete